MTDQTQFKTPDFIPSMLLGAAATGALVAVAAFAYWFSI